jgi:hypothetical protein
VLDRLNPARIDLDQLALLSASSAGRAAGYPAEDLVARLSVPATPAPATSAMPTAAALAKADDAPTRAWAPDCLHQTASLHDRVFRV